MPKRHALISLLLLFISSALATSAESLTQADRDKAMQYLESTRQGVIDATKGLSEAQWNFKAAPDRWSIAECFAHMNNATTKTLPSFDRAIGEGRERRHVGTEPGRYGWFARWMIGSISRPITLSWGPVKPASERKAVPLGKICSSAVWTWV